MRNWRRRIGVLTGGGDAPGLNAVIRAVVRVAVGTYGWDVVGIRDGFEGLILPGKTRLLTMDDVRGILPRGGTILGTSNRANPFSYPIVHDGHKELTDVSADVVARLRDLGVDSLIIIGGDGSLSIGLQLMRKGVPVVGVPKTIDNDLSATDVTFGFDTAVNTATEALDRLHTTAESHHRVLVVEVMGRYAGWIAIQAGLAGGADAILIPEIPFDVNVICEAISHRDRQGRLFSIVVVAEGAKSIGGETVTVGTQEDTGYPRLGGIGPVLAAEISRCTGKETRATVLGHLQRGGTPTAFDRILATRFGTKAVELVDQHAYGQMVALHGVTITSVPLEEAVGVSKFVDPEGELVRTARLLGVTFGDAVPLLRRT